MGLIHSRIFSRRKLVTFSRLWDEFSQEEYRIVAREENMGSEDQDITVHSKKRRRDYHHPKGKHSHQKDNLEDITEIYLNSNVLLVMRKSTMPEIVLEIKVALTRRREIREDIMLMLQR